MNETHTSAKFLAGLPVYRYQQTARNRSPLVWTEVFLRQVNRDPQAGIFHVWPMEKTVILGMMDCQLPQFDRGLQLLRNRGYQPLVRSMGGLAVVADEGVLNVSFILPNHQGHKFDFHQSYHFMVDWIRAALCDQTDRIEVYEIADSYCPGSYDLSIDGRKFAGLAQRMYQNAIVVSAYLSVTGNQERRGQVIADFYREGFANQPPSSRYPQVNPSAMATLSDLLQEELSVADMQDRMERVLVERGCRIRGFQPNEQILSDFFLLQEELKEKHRRYGF